MSDLENAARRLRDSVAALPEPYGAPWLAGGPSGAVLHTVAGLVLPPTPEIAEHIVTWDPPTVALVADLLEAGAALCGRVIVPTEDVDRFETALHALASAILNDQHEGSA